ncbi:MAG: type VI secretion system lipoprotein TssJ [Candidatus Electrothrix sp. GM3_4]|nr:type VI secretion system lipoprotein TssJ [Candidatus Electrothrix sp. GM3_4]
MIKKIVSGRKKIYLPLLLCLVLLTACADDAPKPEWKYGENSIDIVYRAAPDLNTWKGDPNALLLVIYQLKEINEFNRLAGYPEGLRKLLEAKVFDPSVMALKKFYVEPGGARRITLDRAEHTKYVGIVAGYNNLKPYRCVTVQDIGYETEEHGLFKIWKNTKISVLGISLTLGRDGLRVIRKTEVKRGS